MPPLPAPAGTPTPGLAPGTPGEPTPPDAGARKKSKAGWFIGGGAVLLVGLLVGGGALFGAAAAGAAVTEYEDAVVVWQGEALGELVSSTTTYPEDLWDMEDYFSDESLARQAEQCSELQATADRLGDAAAFARPQPSGQPLGFLSGGYGEAVEDAQAKAAVIDAYRVRSQE
ncbi:MAG: hypothetical protein GX624_08110, partial [Actinobacteria bacterium]|nr:hypothetical protein [Actinomycetota bacterium]